jgi:6-phosphogluconolactonase
MLIKKHILMNADETAIAFAENLIDKISARKDGFFNMAVSGGSTPRHFFSLLSNEEYRKQIPWEKVRFFWVDERCVEPTHQESNFGMTYDALLQYAFVPASNIFRMKGEEIPENESQRYINLLRKELPAKDGFPVFDLVLLGMGEDGHTASIFPQNIELLNSDFPVEVSAHPVTGQKRITLTGKSINNAHDVIVLVTGESKAELLKVVLNNEPGFEKYPISHIHNNKGLVTYFLDKDAAKYL